MTRCVFCGSRATKSNGKDQPVCRDHAGEEPKSVACPDCGLPMQVKEGKYGYFWGCEGYPQCKNTVPIAELADKDS